MSSLFIDTPHLAFEIHETQMDASLEMTAQEIGILRELAKKYAEIASLPIQKERKKLWREMNDLKRGKPLIWVNEVCWNEMDVDGGLAIKTVSPVCQRIEVELRKTIYQWQHMQGDMVVEDVFYSPCILGNTGFGIHPSADVAETEKERQVASRHFHNQIRDEGDLEQIKKPVITWDKKRTDDFHQAYQLIFDGIMEIRKRGSPGFWFAPWDDIVFWMGAEEVLINLVLKPDLMHKLIDRLVNSYLEVLDQFEAQNLLALNNTNVRIGSGAYGYTGQLPPEGFNPERIRAKDLWGSATPQIFGSVSPEMHQEFGTAYEMKWLNRFGLAYYGCCEPLHNKIDILKKIPNLRKISLSPWADIQKAVEAIGDQYVLSLKPSPTALAMPHWDPDLVVEELKTKLAAVGDCCVEIIIKDISTVRYQPQRLWEWVKIASEIAERFPEFR